MKLLYEQTKDAKYQFIPCFVNKEDENTQRRRLIMDNLLQREITPSVRMKAIEELQKTYQADKAAGKKLPGRISYLIAQDIGLGKTQVGTYQTVINKGSDKVKSAIKNADITVDAAAKLSNLPKHEQEEYLDSTEDYSLKAITDYVNDKKHPIEAADDCEELSIYDFIDDSPCDDSQPIAEANVISDKDNQIITDVLESLAVIQDFKFIRTRLHSLDDSALGSRIEVLVEEIQELYDEIIKCTANLI